MSGAACLSSEVEATGPLLLDTFTDTDGIQLVNHPLDIGGVPWQMLKSTDSPACWIIGSNTAYKPANSPYAFNYNPIVVDSGLADGVISCDLKYHASYTVSIAFRCGSEANPTFRVVYLYNNKIEQNRWTGTAYSATTSTAFTMISGQIYTVTVEMDGATIIARVGDVELIFTDTLDQAKTKHGLTGYNALVQASRSWDNFSFSTL